MPYPFFPMMINLEGRKVLVVGGGNVASRRANTLITCGAEVVAVSPDFIDDFPAETVRVIRRFTPEDITPDISLVIAATNDRNVNSLIHATAKSMSIPVNVADNPAECDFIFPSLIASGHVAASVCTAGISPDLTRRLSDRLRNVWDSWVNNEGGKILAAMIAGVMMILAGGFMLSGREAFADRITVEVEDVDCDFPAYLEDDEADSWREYVVKEGDTLSGIAESFGNITSHDIMRANGLKYGVTLKKNQLLLIPNDGGKIDATFDEVMRRKMIIAANMSKPIPLKVTAYTIQPGDSLWSIAMKHDIDIETLIGCNGITSSRSLIPGNVIRIPNQDGIFYVFDEGDNIAEICGRYGVDVDKFLSVNNLRNSPCIKEGEEVFLPGAKLR